MRNTMKLALAILLAIPFVIATEAYAAIPLVGGQYNGLFFDNAEVLLDNDGSNSVSVGDTFWGTVQLNGIKGPTTDSTGQNGPTIWSIGGALNPPAEITGYFATDVVAVYLPGDPLASPDAGTTQATIILGPATDPNDKLAAGEVMKVYTDGTVNYDDSSQSLALSTATDGTPWATLGLNGGYWYTLAPLVPPGAGDVGESFAGLNFVTLPAGFNFDLVNDPNEEYSSHSLTLNGLDVQLFFNSELGSNGTFGTRAGETAMHFYSNDPAVVHPTPEPASMLLLGMGLAGLAVSRRKKAA